MIDFDHLVLWLSPRKVMGSYWPDLSRYANNGRIYSNVELKYGVIWFPGGAMDYIDCGNNVSLDCIDFQRTYTFEAWVYSYGINSNNAAIFAKAKGSNNRNGLTHKGTTLAFGYYDGSSWHGVSGTMPQKEWHFVAAVNDEGNLYLYIDGEPQTGTTTPYVANPTQLLLGWSGLNQKNLFKGYLGLLLIYDVARTQKQIRIDAEFTSPYGTR
ncbi:MAG: hypothetical protein DRO01_06720 [Thermoproteota archaeon]|nr:MAG: hypothetical protein DRO01_06720 [Candidatus Korarchaeota archaeon]